MKTTTLAVLAAGSLLTTGCGSTETSDDTSSTTTAASAAESSASESSASESSTSESDAPEGCEKISKDFGTAILDGTPEGATPLKYVSGAAYPSPSGSGVYYVAIRFDDGQGEETGVWAATNLDTGPFLSVDGFAKEFTQWPTEDGINAATPGVDEAKGCLS